MKMIEVRFTIGRTIPLDVLTGDESDKYANVKPEATAVVQLEVDPSTEEGKREIADAYAHAQDACTNQLARFYHDFKTDIERRRK